MKRVDAVEVVATLAAHRLVTNRLDAVAPKAEVLVREDHLLDRRHLPRCQRRPTLRRLKSNRHLTVR